MIGLEIIWKNIISLRFTIFSTRIDDDSMFKFKFI